MTTTAIGLFDGFSEAQRLIYTLVAQGIRSEDITIIGSEDLVRSLMDDGFLDELRLMVYPVVLGAGKRLFEDGGDRRALELVDSRTFGTGVVSLTYRSIDA